MRRKPEMVQYDSHNPAGIQYGEVTGPLWSDKPVAIVANGPSLKGFDYERLRGLCYILAVKGAIFDIPFADAGYGVDAPRYLEWTNKLADVKFPVYWGASGVHKLEKFPHVTFLKRSDGDPPSTRPGWITSGGTSGWSAINLALFKHPRQIVLFGFDYCGGPGDEWHCNEQHYMRKRNQNNSKWSNWSKRFEFLLPELNRQKIEVLNASPVSTIPFFKKVTIDEAVEWLESKRLENAA